MCFWITLEVTNSLIRIRFSIFKDSVSDWPICMYCMLHNSSNTFVQCTIFFYLEFFLPSSWCCSQWNFVFFTQIKIIFSVPVPVILIAYLWYKVEIIKYNMCIVYNMQQLHQFSLLASYCRYIFEMCFLFLKTTWFLILFTFLFTGLVFSCERTQVCL